MLVRLLEYDVVRTLHLERSIQAQRACIRWNVDSLQCFVQEGLWMDTTTHVVVCPSLDPLAPTSRC
jgi:hypothetical protein